MFGSWKHSNFDSLTHKIKVIIIVKDWVIAPKLTSLHPTALKLPRQENSPPNSGGMNHLTIVHSVPLEEFLLFVSIALGCMDGEIWFPERRANKNSTSLKLQLLFSHFGHFILAIYFINLERCNCCYNNCLAFCNLWDPQGHLLVLLYLNLVVSGQLGNHYLRRLW